MMDLSSLLAARRSEILQRWTQRIAQAHADKALSSVEIWDDFPDFFDEVVAALRAGEGSSADAAPAEESTASVAHGAQRLRVGLNLPEMIREYEILTDCILDEVEAFGGTVSIPALRRVLALLNRGRTQAVAAYVDHRDAEIAHAHSQHVAFIAHELRNPLMSAFLGVAVLRKQGRPEDQWALGMLTRNLTTLRELTDQVLTADRLTTHISLKCEWFDLRALLDQTVTENRLTAEQRHIQLVMHAPAALGFSGDQRLLRSAIENVLGNAIKFSHEGTEISVRVGRHAGAITIEVEDSCGGLPDCNAKELFEPSVQRGENRTGFGLGLAIVKQALEAHRGRVSVRNLPGKGCVFSLELPEAQGLSGAASVIESKASPVDGSGMES
jgi:hypothetical protein